MTTAQSPAPPLSTAVDALEELTAGRDIDWDRVAEAYTAAAPDLPESERRNLSARIGQAAGVAAPPSATIARLHDALPEFYERVAFTLALAAAIPVPRGGEVEAISATISEANLRYKFLETFGRRWGGRDPEAAAEWAANLADGEASAAWRGLVTGWADAEPEAVLEWAEWHGLPQATQAATARLARILAGSDPRAGTGLALQLAPSAARRQALAYSLDRWAAQDLEAVIAWTRLSEDPAAKELGLPIVAEAWARNDPAGALAWIASWESDPAAMAVQETAVARAVLAARQTSGLIGGPRLWNTD